MPWITFVSILVFVELALDEADARLKELLTILFQSLFSWNLLLMTGSSSCRAAMVVVSILVFVELALDV